jgi:hypothetical protein
VSPFSPSSLSIIPSIRSEFFRIPISCGPLFNSATKLTKVCNTLPTYELHKSALKVGRRWSIADHGDDYTPWATLRAPLGNLKPSFWKLAKKSEKGTWTRSKKTPEETIQSLNWSRRGMKCGQAPHSEPRYEPTFSRYIQVRVICYAQGTCRGWTLTQLLIRRA